MAKYECKVCSYIYNEQQAGRPFEELTECPICNEDKSNFVMLEEEEVFFEWGDEEEDTIIDLEARPIPEDEEPAAEVSEEKAVAEEESAVAEEIAPVGEEKEEAVAEAAPAAEVKEEAVTEEAAPVAEVKEEVVAEAAPVAEVKEEAVAEAAPAAEVKEEAVAEEVAPVAEVKEEVVAEAAPVAEAKEETVAEEAVPAADENRTQLNDASVLMKDLNTTKDINTDYVVERRQEFWSPFSVKSEKTEEKEQPVRKAWTMENAYASVERVLDLNGNEVKVEEEPVQTTEAGYLDEDVEEPEKELETTQVFKPLWQESEGNLPRVEEPLAAKAENVFKIESPAAVSEPVEEAVEEVAEQTVTEAVAGTQEPVEEAVAEVEKEEVATGAEEAVEEIAAEEVAVEEVAVEEAVTEAAAPEDTAEEVKEDSADIEDKEDAEVEEVKEDSADAAVDEAVEGAAEAVEETGETAEDTEAEAIAEDVDAEEKAEAEEVKEESAEDKDEVIEEAAEEATEEVTEAAEESAAEDKAEEAEAEDKAEELESEDKVEEAEAEDKVEEAEAEDKAEEPAEEKAEAPVFVAPPEAVEKLALNEEFFENIVTELPEDELVITPDGTEPLVVAVVEEDVVEEEVAEVPEEDKFSFGDLDDVEETSEETEEIFIENAEDPDSKWTFNNSMSNTLRGQEENAKRYEFIAKELGQNVVTEEAVEEETVVEEVAEDLAEEVEAVAAEEPATEEKEAVEQPVAAVVAQPVVEVKAEEVYSNGLEDIMILPAQLSPMPLGEKAVIEAATVLGRDAQRPVLLEQPVIRRDLKNVVEYAPQKGLTSEDFQNADVIEILVGRGEGIEKTISSKEDLRQAVAFLRLESDGCPIGIKIAAGRIERDLEFCVFAKPDFVVLNKFNVVPLPYALYRANKYLNAMQSDLDLVIELKDVADADEAAKIVAMGADVIVLSDTDKDLDVVNDQLKTITKETGHYEVKDLNVEDLCTVNRDIAQYTDIEHV